MRGKKIAPELVDKIIELSGSGMAIKSIAQELGLPVTTVHNHLYDKEPKCKTAAERVKAEAYTGNVSAKDAARLKKIGEKTGLPVSYNYSEGFGDEENIYAYDGSMSIADFEKRIDMAQKEEPATAGTVTSSEADNTASDNTSIAPIAPDVKPSAYSEASKSAVYEAYAAKMAEVSELDRKVLELDDIIDDVVSWLRDEQADWLGKYQFANAEAARIWDDYERMGGGSNDNK